MSDVKLELNKQGRGAFNVYVDDAKAGEMEVAKIGNDLVVYHTEVQPQYEGKGFAKELLNAMVDYARQHKLKVIPLCPYTLAQFKRHPDLYDDVWNKSWKTKEA